MKRYTVGGCVRDEIMGLTSNDIDFTFVLDDLTKTVQEGFLFMENWMKERNFEIFLCTPEMFTIRAKFPKGDPNEKLVADFVMARKEIGYIEGTRRPILVLGTLEDDLIRRDFTVNSLATDEEGNLIDLFNGAQDIKDKILRTPLDPNVTFLDDPLRLLRLLRFSITKNFNIHDSCWEAMKNPEILYKLEKVVSKERIREELYKMFKYNTPRTLELLHDVTVIVPNFYSIIFSESLWLKPTFES